MGKPRSLQDWLDDDSDSTYDDEGLYKNPHGEYKPQQGVPQANENDDSDYGNQE